MNKPKHDYSSFFYFNPIPSWVYDLETFQILDVNQAATHHYGYTEDEFLKLSLKELHSSPDVPKLISAHAGIEMQEGNVYFGIFTHKKKNGDLIRMEINGHKVDYLGKASMMLVCRDVTEQEKQIKQLKEAEQKLKTVSSIAKLGYWYLEADANKLIWSDEVYKIWERKKEDFEPDVDKFFQTIHPDDREKFKEEQSSAFNGEKDYDFVHRILLPDGTIRWVHELGRLEQDVKGKPKAFEGTVQDITNQKELELRLIETGNKLSESEKRFRITQEISPDGFTLLHPVHNDKGEIVDFTWVFENQAIANINGTNPNDVVGRKLLDLLPSHRNTALFNTYIHVANTGESKILEEVYVGDIIAKPTWLRLVIVPMGEDIAILTQNITERKLAEEAVRESEGRFRTIFEIASLGIAQVDPSNGQIVLVNSYYESVTGYQTEELLQMSFLELTHPDDREKDWKVFSRAARGEEEYRNEKRYVKKDGTIVWVRLHVAFIRDEMGKPISTVAICEDITERNKLQELNRQTSKLARIGSWEIDLTGNKLYWSDMVYELHEMDPETFVPDLDKAINFYREDYLGIVKEKVEQCISEGIPFDFEAIMVTAKQNEKWVRVIGNAEMVNEKCHRIYGSFQDIHPSKSLEYQIQEILGSISDAFYAVDGDWNFTYFNREAENLLQKTALDIVGKNIWQVFPAAINTPLDEIYNRVVATGKPESFEYLFPGDGRWYEVNAYPSGDGLSAYFKNIDERKQAAVELEKAYQEKNNILESIGDAFFSVNKDWMVTYWNKEAENFLGRKREDILGKNLWEAYADAIDSAFYRQYHLAIETGDTVSFEEYYPKLKKWFEVSAYPSKEGLSIYFKDVTLRKEADIRLQEANERFEKVTEATNDAIWDWNIQDRTLYWGGGFEKLFGYRIYNSTAPHDSWTKHIHPMDKEGVMKSKEEILDKPNQYYWSSEYRYQKNDGNFADVNDRGIVIRNEQGKAIRMVGAMTDISERKHFEQQLVELNKSLKEYAHQLEITNEQLEQFAFIASHDLQEPLRMISSFMDQLKRKYGDRLDEKGHQYIHFATDGASRMRQIILDLLEYSRAGKLMDTVEKIDLNKIIADYGLLRKRVITEKSVKLNSIGLPVVHAYKVPLTQTLHCLLDNAIKYSFEGRNPQIDLSAEELDEYWKIGIKDNGIGIDPKFFEKIFIIFQRLHNREKYSGTGIGLSIAKKHIESWGGEIWLESFPGKGSTFYFSIPKNKSLKWSSKA